MRDLEKSRMNFLRQGRNAFTYRSMIFAMAGWCVFLAALYGVGLLRESAANRELVEVKRQIDKFNAEKDAQLKLMESLGSNRIGFVAREDLAAILSTRPAWSRVLRQLTKSLPSQVWLQSVKVMPAKGEDVRIDITGKAKSQRQLTNFIMTLESTGLFRRTELAGTKKLMEKDAALEFDIVTTPVLNKF